MSYFPYQAVNPWRARVVSPFPSAPTYRLCLTLLLCVFTTPTLLPSPWVLHDKSMSKPIALPQFSFPFWPEISPWSDTIFPGQYYQRGISFHRNRKQNRSNLTYFHYWIMGLGRPVWINEKLDSVLFLSNITWNRPRNCSLGISLKE